MKKRRPSTHVPRGKTPTPHDPHAWLDEIDDPHDFEDDTRGGPDEGSASPERSDG